MPETKQSGESSRLKSEIEIRLNWGESIHWSNYDFEKLNQLIFEKTSVTLSISTLKRFFGKINSQSAPSLTTLNTLAQFLDYADWRAFIASVAKEKGNIDKEIAEKKSVEKDVVENIPAKRSHVSFLKYASPLIAVLVIGIFAFYYFSKKRDYNPKDFSFFVNKILNAGVPNSVVFNYDAAKAKEGDSVFIAQTWDTRRKVLVNKNDKHYSAIYYYPGYFKAKLMIGNEIIREHDIQIKTDGWLGLVEADWDKVPLYFEKDEIVQGKAIAVDEALLNKHKVSFVPNAPKTCFFNQRNFGNITIDNFTFETQLKSNFFTGASACQRVQVLLQTKDDMLVVPLASKGCVGDISLYAYGLKASSKTDDLSGFGADLNEWTTLRIECKNHMMIFFVNGKKAYAVKLANKPSPIVGFEFRFEGCGAMRNTWIEGQAGKVEL